MIKTVSIDPTSDSVVYNPLGSAGRWVTYSFGRRNVDFSADPVVLMNTLAQLPDLSAVTFHSEFGDSACWPHIVSLCQYLKTRNIAVSIHTYGMMRPETTQALYATGAKLLYKICGIEDLAGSVFLGARWDTISRNIELDPASATVEFSLFKHNAHQLEDVARYANHTGCGVQINNYFMQDRDGFASVIDSSGNWLYDIHHPQSSSHTLVQTVRGWHILKNYIKAIKGAPVDQLTTISLPLGAQTIQPVNQCAEWFITLRGHVVKGSCFAQVISNALCSDWDQKSIDAFTSYGAGVLNTLTVLTSISLERINIYSTPIADILSYVSQQKLCWTQE